MSNVATMRASTQVARPLKVLEPLIKEDFEQGEQAGMAYFKAAGEKLHEARDSHFEDDARGFYRWAEKKFGKKQDQIRAYMSLGAPALRKSFSSLREMERHTGRRSDRTGGAVFREWTAPVDQIADKARDEAMRVAREDALTRAEDRAADAKLALRLIDIGFKVLARELHPDKGGSRDAMTRLNKVRSRLKEMAQHI